MRILFCATGLVGCCLALQAHAAGFAIKEQSALSMGRAFAGSAADVADAGAMAYNPATLAGVTGTDTTFSTIEIVPHFAGTYGRATTAAGTPAGGSPAVRNYVADAPIPTFALRHRLTDDVAVGLGVSMPFGMKTKYPADWAGRYYALESKVVVVRVSPTAAWQVTPELALGASLSMEYARGVLSSVVDFGSVGALKGVPGAVPGQFDGQGRLSGISWKMGYALGLVYQPAPGWTFGLGYQGATTHTLHGPMTFKLDPAGLGLAIRNATGVFADTRATAKLSLPDSIQFGARAEVTDRFAVMAELDWSNWSRFRELVVVPANPAQPLDTTHENWRNAIFASLGAEYRLEDRWTLRGGAGFDQSPTPASTRTPRIPDTDRYWLTAGLSYRLTEGTTVSLSYGRVFLKDGTVALQAADPGNAMRGSLTGTTSASADVIGIHTSMAL